MKLMFASDIHGSAFYCKQLLEAVDREKPEKLVLLGDLLYHGPRNDLPKDYAPKQVISMLNERKNMIMCVRGNCEAEVDQMVLEFPCLADYSSILVDGNVIYVTHGHVYNKDNLLCKNEGDILIYGHTHVPLNELVDGVRVMNPGSVSIPKQDSWHGYIVYENGAFVWKNLEGEVQDI